MLVATDIVAQIRILAMFSLGWHGVVNTYRMVSSGHGAFGLCLPSLGILYQIYLLRCENIHRTPRMTWSWVRVATVCTLPRHAGLQHYEVSVGGGGVGLRPGLLEVPVADVLGIA